MSKEVAEVIDKWMTIILIIFAIFIVVGTIGYAMQMYFVKKAVDDFKDNVKNISESSKRNVTYPSRENIQQRANQTGRAIFSGSTKIAEKDGIKHLWGEYAIPGMPDEKCKDIFVKNKIEVNRENLDKCNQGGFVWVTCPSIGCTGYY